ncbi:uncharacterized protein [Eurosta solidaginis]|uniref:uncharacterized protein n=1 Tax=Eurosta solidaginis TaxID=178769 RepID=UPI003530E870
MSRVRKCVARGCLNTEKVLPVFRWPVKPSQDKKWRAALGIALDAHIPKWNYYVCRAHFTDRDLHHKGNRLREDAVPYIDATVAAPIAEVADEEPMCYATTFSAPVSSTPIAEPRKRARKCCIGSCAKDESCVLYSFPSDEAAFNSWATACCLNVPFKNRKTLSICERHFDSKYLAKNRVLKGAFPKYHLEANDFSSCSGISENCENPNEMPEGTFVLSDERPDITLQEFEKFSDLWAKRGHGHSSELVGDDIDIFQHPELMAKVFQMYLKKDVQRYKRILELEKEVQDLKKVLETAIIPSENASADAITFARMIVDTTFSYPNAESKTLAQNINYMSTKAYNFLRDDLNFALPHKKTLLSWRPIKYVVPGIDSNIISNLKTVVRGMSADEKVCEILFDEISIKKDLVYNRTKDRDLIDGFVDLGNNRRKQQVADKCCFFMVKGITSHWKYVLSYYTVKNGLKAEELREILFENIQAVEDVGLSLKAVICDQAKTNVSMYEGLNVTKDHPFIFVKGKKIYFMYDYCHLIKSVRNNLHKYNLVTGNGLASFAVIRKLYEVDKKNPNFKICPKLTSTHIDPNCFEKMSVSRATQVLSNSVAAGIDMAWKKGLFSDDSFVLNHAIPTQIFVKRMNDIFDELNCKKISSNNPIKWPMNRKNNLKVKRLMDHVEYLEAIVNPNDKVTCFEGLILTIKAMISLSSDIFEDYPKVEYILLGKLNQDALENLFYKIRASQGINTHPSAHDIQYIVARLVTMRILRYRFDNKNKGNNCEDDEDLDLEWNTLQEDAGDELFQVNEQVVLTEVADPTDQADESKEVDEDDLLEEEEELLDYEEEEAYPLSVIPALGNFSPLTLEDEEEVIPGEIQVQRYYTGYTICNTLFNKLNCDNCSKATVKPYCDLNSDSEALIRSKNYKGNERLLLVNPSDDVFELCHRQMFWYKQIFSQRSHYPGLKENIIDILTTLTEHEFPNWFSEAGPCLEHRKQLLDSLVVVLLFKNARWMARDDLITTRERHKSNKLKRLNAQPRKI